MRIAKYQSLSVCLCFLILFFFIEPSAHLLLAQQRKTTKVELKQADVLKADELLYGKNVQVVSGNVRFDHVNTIMYCDSAYFYRDSNVVVAFNNIHIIQNDSIHLFGDKLNYLGNISLAKVRDNVRLEKGNVKLTTEFLDYDRNKQIGYYFNGGTIVNEQNTLISDWGYYYPNLNEAFFKDSVVLNNPDYSLFSDTLKYNTNSEVAKIIGPTFIVSKTNTIYAEDGFYDTKNNLAYLLKNGYVQGKEAVLKGDTIMYNRNVGIGEVYGKMQIIDTINQVIIKGNYGYYNEINKTALATRRAQLLQFQDGDTLYLHADTLRSEPIDTTDAKLIRAYHHVKFFRKDIQGLCDSMVYNMVDSTNTLFHSPVIWAEGSQLTAETITMYQTKKGLDKILLKQNAFLVSQEDSALFNQIKGKDMMGYIRNRELYKIDVDGNAQTIYYPKDSETTIGVNRSECSNMTIYFNDKKPQRIVMRNAPNGNMNPPYILPDEKVKLKGFVWLDIHRPKNKEDIFVTAIVSNAEVRKTFSDFVDEGVGILMPKSSAK